jgi:hypothetical protein
LTQVTPLALKRNATPPVIRFTTAVFYSFAAGAAAENGDVNVHH